MPSQWAADFHHGRRGQSITHERPTTCCHCPKKLPKGRYLYCSDECALESQRQVWRIRHKEEPFPARFLGLESYRVWLAAR